MSQASFIGVLDELERRGLLNKVAHIKAGHVEIDFFRDEPEQEKPAVKQEAPQPVPYQFPVEQLEHVRIPTEQEILEKIKREYEATLYMAG